MAAPWTYSGPEPVTTGPTSGTIVQEDSASRRFLDFLSGLGNIATGILGAVNQGRTQQAEARLTEAQLRAQAQAQTQTGRVLTWLLIGGGVLVAVILLAMAFRK